MIADLDARLDALLADVLDLPPGPVPADLSAETSAAWDSANHLRIVFAAEEAFGISLTLEEIERATSRAALREMLARPVEPR